MSSYEFGGDIPPVYGIEPLEGLFDSFRSAMVDEVLSSLALEPDILDCVSHVTKLAKLDPEKALGFLEQARLSIAMNGVTEDNHFDVCQVAGTYADLGLFDEALAVAETIDEFDPPGPDQIDYQTVLFRFNGEKIPEKYLERAVLAIARMGNNEGVLGELYTLGERYPAARSLILGLATQIITDHILPEAEAPEMADFALAEITYYAAGWGDMSAVRAHFGNMHTTAHKLGAELEVYQKTRVLLEHQNLGQVYEAIVSSDAELAGTTKVYLLLELHKLGHTVDGEVIRAAFSGLDDDNTKLRLMSDFVKAYDDDDVYRQLVESVTEQYVEDAWHWLKTMAKAHPGLLVDCEPAILSALIQSEGSKTGSQLIAKALLSDYLAVERQDDAIALAQSFEGKAFFRYFRKLQFQEDIVKSIAQRGREHFDRAFSLVATFSEGCSSYNYCSLLSSLVTAAHDYLTPDERESYLQACGGSFMTYNGWLELAKSTNRLEYLVRAKQFLASDEQSEGFTYRQRLLDVLEAYQQITAKVKSSQK